MTAYSSKGNAIGDVSSPNSESIVSKKRALFEDGGEAPIWARDY
jgi:hypothetical protein